MLLPEEATIVRQMYQWVDEEGLSIGRVARRLNIGGLLPDCCRKIGNARSGKAATDITAIG